MSGNRRKNTNRPPVDTNEQLAAARLVAMPKEAAANAATDKNKPARIGEALRQARLEKNDDLYLIAEYLRIKPAFLLAIEGSRYDEFPADAYVIGFLRTYANFLGIDGKEAVDRYRYEMAGRRKKPILSMPTPVMEGRAPSGIIIVAATLAVLLIYALWYGISSANRTEVNVPPPLPTVGQPTSATTPVTDTTVAAGLTAPVAPTAVAPASAAQTQTATPVIPPAAPGIVVTEEAPATSAAASAAAVSAKKNVETKPAPTPTDNSRVVIHAAQSSWVMITDETGKAIYDHVMKAGDIYKVPNRTGLSMTTGNGSGITISLDGTDLPKVANGAPHVVRNISLDPARLATETPASTN